MPVDASVVRWLKEGALFEASTDAGISAAWGSDAIESELVSALALSAAAVTEAGRQQAFLEGPLAVETHDVPGLRFDLLGRPITIVADRLGYAPGLDVFVIAIAENERTSRTVLTVLRRQT